MLRFHNRIRKPPLDSRKTWGLQGPPTAPSTEQHHRFLSVWNEWRATSTKPSTERRMKASAPPQPHSKACSCAGKIAGPLPERTARPPACTSSQWDPWPEPTCCKERNRSEEHTSELQSRQYLVCRLLLE